MLGDPRRLAGEEEGGEGGEGEEAAEEEAGKETGTIGGAQSARRNKRRG